jgi:TRAP-type C4-dicarboxylate transport system permease small subunit
MISAKSYDKYLQYFLFFQMISLSITVLLGVCFRWAGHSLVWYDEIAGIQLAWITYFGSIDEGQDKRKIYLDDTERLGKSGH